MAELTNEQLLMEAVGLLDRLSERLGGVDLYVGARKPGQYTDANYYLVRVGNMSVANPDPVVALYEAMGKREAA